MAASRPASWADLMKRMAQLAGGTDDQFVEETRVWLQQAIHATWGVDTMRDLSRGERHVAFQKASGVLLQLQDHDGDLGFTVGCRHVVACAFARYFAGVALDGPPWAMDPLEDRPAYEEWKLSRHAKGNGVQSANDTERLTAPGVEESISRNRRTRIPQ